MRNSDWKSICVCFAICIFSTISLSAQEFVTIHNFKGLDGANPYTALTQGTNGNFYGTTIDGGPNGAGNIFVMNASGQMIPLYNFCSQSNCTDGENPAMPLIVGLDGNLYGTASNGGVGGWGTIFKITPSGNLTTLYSFSGSDGANPYSPLLLASDGNFYGTTNQGGFNGGGTIYQIAADGNLTTLYNFCSTINCEDGEYPVGALIQATDGNIYGTTHAGGNQICHDGCGTVFKLNRNGTVSTLVRFHQTNGEYPYGGVVQGTDGNLYGTTGGGGSVNSGTVFKITSAGITILHSFDSTDGSSPYALNLGSDGNLYGTTSQGGTYGVYGTVFQITTAGSFTTLHDFDVSDGALVYSGLLQSTTGTFYGTTYFGGNFNDGTVFSLNNGLGPFVNFVVAAGKPGQATGLLGQGFTGTSSVSFNGTSAIFTVVSDTYIRVTVPVDATTGYVTVTTPSGTLSSAVQFVVNP